MGKLNQDQLQARADVVVTADPSTLLREDPVWKQHLDELGREIPDPTPMAPPVGYVKREAIHEMMARMIKQASAEAEMAGAETEEQANDFDVDDEEPWSPYENDFEFDPAYEMMLARQSRPPAEAPKPSSPPSAAGAAQPAASVVPQPAKDA